jgi:diguanylate cyclase (GGDEF)-like protein
MLWLTFLIAVLVAAAAFTLFRVREPLGELHHRAGTDDLTGLANRRRLFEEGADLVRSAHESGSPVCVAMFDLDDFKSVNDDFGHEVGDDVLREVAVSLYTASRERDLVARLGGDEFVTVMRVASAEAARRAVERSRTGVKVALGSTFPELRGLGVTVGFSVSDDGHQDLGTLIHEADLALIKGKRHDKGIAYPSVRGKAARSGQDQR